MAKLAEKAQKQMDATQIATAKKGSHAPRAARERKSYCNRNCNNGGTSCQNERKSWRMRWKLNESSERKNLQS